MSHEGVSTTGQNARTTLPGVGSNACRTVLGTFAECPLCGSALRPEHAHFKCSGCGWRDSCCD